MGRRLSVLDLNSDKAQSFYYSSHHLARDLFWNAGNFAFFIIIGVALDERLRKIVWEFTLNVSLLSSTIVQVAIALICLALGAVSGVIASFVYTSVTPGLSRTRLWRFTFEGRYSRDQDLLRTLYAKVFGSDAQLLEGACHRPMDLVVRLTTFMRLYNPSGYVHVFRTYSIVSLFRQGILYSFALIAWSVAHNARIEILFFLALTVMLFLALREALAYSITREYAFMFATYHWIEQQRSLEVEAP